MRYDHRARPRPLRDKRPRTAKRCAKDWRARGRAPYNCGVYSFRNGDRVVVVMTGSCQCTGAIVYIGNSDTGTFPSCPSCGGSPHARYRAEIRSAAATALDLMREPMADLGAAIAALPAVARALQHQLATRRAGASLGYHTRRVLMRAARPAVTAPEARSMPAPRVAAAAVAWPAQLRRFRGNA